ncbi:MAG: PAS domain S-box protein [Bacteroidia bacterium]|nr:PAS domain S-box protein [Bacteroidia bacterium]
MIEKYLNLDFGRTDLVLIALIPSIINFLIFLYVFVRLPSTWLNFIFSLFALTISFWQLSSGFTHLSESKQTAIEWNMISNIFSIIVFPLGIYFLININGWIKWISEYSIFFLLIFPNVICVLLVSARLDSYSIVQSQFWQWIFTPATTLANSIIYFCIITNALAIFILLCISYFKVKEGDVKKASLILLLGYLIPFLIGVPTEIILPLFSVQNDIPLGAPLSTLFSISAFIAVLKFKILDFSPQHQWDVIVNKMNESLLIVDDNDKIMYVNDKFCDELQYQRHELIGKIAYDLIINGESDKQRIKEINIERKNRKSSSYEITLYTKTGKPKCVMINGSPYINKLGNIIGSIALISNIDELKKANIAIENEKKKAESIINSLPGTFYLFDQNGKFLLWNKNFETVSGYSCEELKLMSPLDFFDETEKPKIKQKIESVFLNGYDEIDSYFYTKDKINIPYYCNGYKYIYDGKPCLIGMGLDISEHKNTEAKLKVKEEYYRTLVEQAPDAILITDPQLNIIDINTYGCTLLGYTKQELLKMKVSDLITSKNLIEKPINLGIIKKDKVTIAERVLKTKDDIEKNIEVRVKLMSDGNYQSFLTDITERYKTIDEINKLNSELTRKSQILEKSNAELEQFAYVASHDMQEPLRMVSGFMKLLDEKYNDTFDDTAKEYIKHAIDGATRMKQLIYDLLEYSKAGKNRNDLSVVNLNQILDEIIFLNKNAITERNAKINYGKLPEIFAIKTSISQVFQNLISNALKYTPDEKEPIINITCEETDIQWKFCISDNGTGIDPKFHEKIFVIFQRAVPGSDKRGTGIGLAICKKIVELHNGKIWVESEPGTGTSFFFTISKAM